MAVENLITTYNMAKILVIGGSGFLEVMLLMFLLIEVTMFIFMDKENQNI